MTMKVVRPARTSVARVVPRSENLKYVAIASTVDRSSFPRRAVATRRARTAPDLDRLRLRGRPPRLTVPRGEPSLPPLPRVAGPAGPAPDALLDLSGVEALQLHLDETAGVELELARAVARVDLGGERGVLDDDPLVALDQGVDEELIGAGIELEMLERVDVEADRDRGEVGRRVGIVHDDPLDPAGAVGDQVAPALVAVRHGLLEER